MAVLGAETRAGAVRAGGGYCPNDWGAAGALGVITITSYYVEYPTATTATTTTRPTETTFDRCPL